MPFGSPTKQSKRPLKNSIPANQLSCLGHAETFGHSRNHHNLGERYVRSGNRGRNQNKVDPQPDSHNNNQDGQKTPSVIVQVGTQQADTTETREKNDTDQQLVKYTCWLAIFTGLLFLVSAIQGYFLWRQAHHLEKHGLELHSLAHAARSNADAAKDTAETARKQTDHIAAAERAWLTVAMGDAELPLKDISDDLIVWFTPNITNCGRTVAHVTKMYLRVRFCDSVSWFTHPPRYEDETDQPDDGSHRFYGGRMFDENVLIVPNGTAAPVRVNLTGPELRRLTDGGNTRLYLYGYVEYRTVGTPNARTGFCLSYHIPGTIDDLLEGLPRGWVVYGPGGYNYAK